MGSEAVNLPVSGPAADENRDSSAAKRDAKMAADIAELRSIVLAAAKHFKVELPSDKIAPPRPPRPSSQALSELARTLAEGYDEEVTVRHRVSLAPAESMLGANQWESIFGLKSPAPRVTITPPSDAPLDTKGIHTLAEWQVSPLTAQHLYEYGYTADGRFYPLNVKRPANGSAYRVVSRRRDHDWVLCHVADELLLGRPSAARPRLLNPRGLGSGLARNGKSMS